MWAFQIRGQAANRLMKHKRDFKSSTLRRDESHEISLSWYVNVETKAVSTATVLKILS